MSDEEEEMKAAADKGDYDDRKFPAHKLMKKTPGQNDVPSSDGSTRKKKRTPGQ